MEEIWRDIENFEDSYQISNFGRIKSKERDILFGKNTRHLDETILNTKITNGQYYVVCLNKHSKKTRFYVHRLVAYHFQDICGKWFDGCVVDHIDTNKLNNMASNLCVCTQKENTNNPITKEKNKISHNTTEYKQKMSLMQIGKKKKPHTEKWKIEHSQKLKEYWNKRKHNEILHIV